LVIGTKRQTFAYPYRFFVTNCVSFHRNNPFKAKTPLAYYKGSGAEIPLFITGNKPVKHYTLILNNVSGSSCCNFSANLNASSSGI
jgi:hypothetical protein